MGEVAVFNSNLPITEAGVKEISERKKLLAKFIRKEMKPDIDFGIIPGTQKASLFKPGAEKLARLFGLGVRIVDSQKEIDLHQNFAMFTYRMEAYHLATGVVVAQCEGACNSFEKKYKDRAVYEYNRSTNRKEKVRDEETPIGDVLNTLMKMAQKRGYVGVIMQATGASDFYTQDVEDETDAEAIGLDTRPKPQTVKAKVPGVKSAGSVDDNSAPICCGKPMMVSKVDKNTHYCVKCRSSKPIAYAEPAAPAAPPKTKEAVFEEIKAWCQQNSVSPKDLAEYAKDNLGKATHELSANEMIELFEMLKSEVA